MFLYNFFCILPFTVCLVWTFILLWDSVGQRRRDLPVLTVFLFACTLLYLGHAFHFSAERKAFCLMDVFYAAANLAVYPLFFLWLRCVADGRGIRKTDVLLLLPAGAVFVFALFVFFTGGSPVPVFWCNRIFFPLTVLFTLVEGLRLLSAYNRTVRNFYADAERKSLESLSVLLVIFVITSILSAILNFIGRDYFLHRSLLLVPSLLFSILLFIIAYIGSRLPFAVQDVLADISGNAPSEESGADTPHAELLERLDELMRREKLFKRPGLKITDLAGEVGTNRTYLSNAINQQMKMSFSEYVNHLRVEEAKRLIRESGGQMLQNVVAEEAGFSNEATFYRRFRQAEGLTPGEWWRKQ